MAPLLVLLLLSSCLVRRRAYATRASKFVGRRADSALHRSEDAGIIRGMHTAGIDLGGTKVQGVIVDGDGSRLGEARGRTPTSGGPAGGGAGDHRGGQGGAQER